MLEMSEEGNLNIETVTELEMSCVDNTNSECGSYVTISTDSTTLRKSNRSLMLTIKSLINASNALTVTTEKSLEDHVDILERKTNIEKMKTKCQLRDSEELLIDATQFLINNVKTLRKTMKTHRFNIEQLVDQVELQVSSDEYQDETKDHETQAICLSEDDEISADEFGRLCDPCFVQKKKKRASFFCENCNEEFCIDCMNFHRVENNSENHKVGSIASVTLFCAACRLLSNDVEATVYCIDCIDPKPFCSRCADKHRAMKKTRGHNMSFDIDNLRLRFDQTESSQEWFEVVKKRTASCTSTALLPTRTISQYTVTTTIETEIDDMALQLDHLRLRFNEMERQHQLQQWGVRKMEPVSGQGVGSTRVRPINVVKPTPQLIKRNELRSRFSPSMEEILSSS